MLHRLFLITLMTAFMLPSLDGYGQKESNREMRKKARQERRNERKKQREAKKAEKEAVKRHYEIQCKDVRRRMKKHKRRSKKYKTTKKVSIWRRIFGGGRNMRVQRPFTIDLYKYVPF